MAYFIIVRMSDKLHKNAVWRAIERWGQGVFFSFPRTLSDRFDHLNGLYDDYREVLKSVK